MFTNLFSGNYFGLLTSILISLGLVAGITLLVVLVVLLVRRVTNSTKSGDGVAEDVVLSAREILQIRYVCGEIDRDQYFEMLGDLA